MIHEQQLGLDWRPPGDAVFTPVHGGPAGEGGAGGSAGGAGDEEADEDAAAKAREQEVRVL